MDNICVICQTKTANPSLEGNFGRPVCDDCFAEQEIEMEEELSDIEDLS